MPFAPREIRTSWRMVRPRTRKPLSYVQAKTNYIWGGKLSGTISRRVGVGPPRGTFSLETIEWHPFSAWRDVA